MSQRLTWVKGKMWFPEDVDPADVDWDPPLPTARTEIDLTSTRRNSRDFCPSTNRTGKRLRAFLGARQADSPVRPDRRRGPLAAYSKGLPRDVLPVRKQG
jgi:hypothetical protein